MSRLKTGIPDLDLILGGGLEQGSLVILAGAPGTGKTILAQQICFANATRTSGSTGKRAAPTSGAALQSRSEIESGRCQFLAGTGITPSWLSNWTMSKYRRVSTSSSFS